MKCKIAGSLLLGVSVGYGLVMAGSAQAGMQIENLKLMAAKDDLPAASAGAGTAQAGQDAPTNKLVLVAANDVQPASAAGTATGTTTGTAAGAGAAQAGKDVPIGQSPGGQPNLLPENAGVVNEKNVFGMEGGYFHPYASIQEQYTDNLYNLDTPKTSNYLTTLTAGLWLATPRKKEIPISITTNNSSAGGLQQQLKDYQGTDRYLAYALGELDYKNFSSDSNLNVTDGLLEGLFRYNLRGGLSLQAVDRFTRGEDRFDIGTVQPQHLQGKYTSNYVVGTADWQITDKVRAKFDYSNFVLNYDETFDKFKTRVDNAIDLYGYYDYSVKTAFFLEDQYIDVSYDSAKENDNKQNFVYGGINWKTTEKLSLLAKAGVQSIKYDNNLLVNNNRDSYSGLALDMQAQYKFTEKTQFSLDLYRSNQETDSAVAAGKTVTGVKAGYHQKYTDKLSGQINLGYEDGDYQQLVSQSRDDREIIFQPALQYLFREWLQAELSYTFDKRDSTDNLFDFQSNTVMLSLKFAM